ncbi:carboxypeptidase regulatory-like domain-containing protein [Oleiharenicola sp. Vm1]|uniref:carboxypeptidase regulatory-like domain-containing protein n=1 Tax=Oleiharenicola sp. Vm1 TaxID=3398393 RepID=UPI0039F5CB6B
MNPRSLPRPPFLRPARVLAALAALAGAVVAARADAVIEGRVALPKSRATPVVNQRYEIVSKDGVLATNPPLAVAYLAGDFARPAARRPTAQVGQENMSFVPTLLAIEAGTVVEFPNHDDVYHNIFSYSPTKRFDLGRYRKEDKPVPTVTFETPGLVVLRCDIHEHMRGLILVLDTPHFVTTDAAGNFRLGGLPAGRFTLKVWRDSRTTLARTVELRDGETLHVEFP